MKNLLQAIRALYRYFFLALVIGLLLPTGGQAQHMFNYTVSGAGTAAFDGFYVPDGTTTTSMYLRWVNTTGMMHYLINDTGGNQWCLTTDDDPTLCVILGTPNYNVAPAGEPAPTMGWAAQVGAGAPAPEVNNTLLPVELTSFKAVVNGEKVTLMWETATETNNAGFGVEQRIDGTFQQLGFVDGYGTTLEAQSYNFQIDNVSGRQVFRLKQVDYDGTFEYSQELEVVADLPGAYLLSAPYPNPFNPQTTFTLNVATTQQVRIEVFNVLGHSVQVLHDGSLTRDETHRFTFSANDMANGTYFIRAIGEAFNATRSVLLMK
jgi:hypothetical protein